MPSPTTCVSRTLHRRRALAAAGSLALLLAANLPANAQPGNPDFNAGVNTGPVPPNAATVFPGEATSLRVTLSNNSLVNPITGVNYSGALETTATAGLVIDGVASITGDAGCVGGTLTTTPGQPGISLSGLTIPVRVNGVPGSGECYLDLPVRAFTTDGGSTTLSLDVAAGDVSSDQGTNATGGPQAITVRGVDRPTVTKAFDPDGTLILNGQPRTLVITINNPNATFDLTDLALDDIFPTRAVVGALLEPTLTAAGGSCVAGGATVDLFDGAAARVEISGATVPAAGSCTVTVDVQGRTTDGEYERLTTNTIDSSSFSSFQGLTPASDATAQVRVRSPLAVSKSFSPSVLASGEEGQFTIFLTNSSDTALPVTNFTDDPIGTPNPGNLSIASTTDISNSCGGSATLESSGEGFSVSGFNIPARIGSTNGECVITVSYTAVSTTPDAPVSYTNSIPQGAVQVTSAFDIVSQEQSATVIVADRLRIRKNRSPSTAAPGDAVRYRVFVENYSDTILNNVTLTDTFQNGSTLLRGGSFEPEGTTACGTVTTADAQGSSSVLFNIQNVPARTGPGSPGVCRVTFWAMIDPLATANTPNVIGAGDACFDNGAGVTCNQSGSNNTNINLRDPVEFEKSFDGVNTVAALEGTPVRLRLELRNFAAAALTDVVFSDTLPAAGPFQQLRVASPSNISNSCGGTVTAAAGSTSVALNNGSVPAFASGSAGSCAVEVDVVGPAGSYPNTARATGNRPNADGSVTPIAPIGTSLEDTATVNYAPALSTSKSFTPDSAADGSISTLQIAFENLDGTQPITGISATDTLPAGMVVATPSGAYSTCAGPAIIDAVSGAGTVGISGANLPPGANCALLVNVQVTGSSDWINSIPAGGITADNGIVNTSPVAATLRYEPPGEPLISKAITPGTIVPGQSATLTVTLTNGTQDLTGVTVTDWFTDGGASGAPDNGMRIAPAPAPSTTCPAGIVTALPDSNNVRLSGASIAANDTCTFSVQVTSTSVGTLTNRIPLNAIVSDQGATNGSTFAESTLSTTSELGVSKQFTPPVVSANEPSRLRIEFFNGSASAITGFALTDTYPSGMVNAPDPNPISNCGPATVTLPSADSVAISNGTLSAAVGDSAASCFLEVNVVSPSEGTFDNTIPADTLTVRGIPVTHPPAMATLQVRERIIVNKAFDDLTLDSGDPNGFTTGNAVRLPGVSAPLTIRLENPNDIALTQVSFVDEFPDGLTLAVPPNLSTDCTNGLVSGVSNGRTVTLAGAELAPRGSAGSSCTVTAEVFSNLPDIYTNEIPLGGVTSFEGVDNDPGTQAQLVVSEPPTIAKDFAPPVIAPGDVATLTLTLGNENDVAGNLTADLVDTLPTSPGAMLIATPPGISTNCPGGVGIVDSVAGDAAVVIESGTTVPPGGCVVSVDVTASDPGEYLNTIPVGALQTTLGTSDQPASSTLRISTLGYISGKVFLDNQTVPDGSFIPGDSDPLPGSLIELRSGADCSGALLTSVSTDSQGNYLFADLAAGSYSVCQPAQPPATFNSIVSEGPIVPFGASTGVPGVPANPTDSSSQITNIVLGDNAGNSAEVSGSPDNNFSEVLPATLSGNVYFDANNDGVFDADESGIGGVTIELVGPVTVTTTTAADGSWSFSNLPPGDYTVSEVQPGGWTDGLDTVGTVGGVPSGDDSVSDVFSAIVLGPGSAGVEYNFGETAPSAITLSAAAVCANDTPYVDYSISAFAGPSSPAVTVRWITSGGRVAEELTNQPGSGRLLWPGAAIDGGGNPTAWPGWAFTAGEWVEVADDRIPTMTLEVEFNPTGSTVVSYPPASAACFAAPVRPSRVQAIPATPPWALALMMLAMAGAALRRAQMHSPS